MEKITQAQVKMVRSLQQKKYRDELGYFVAEGDKCIGELRDHYQMVLYADKSNATTTQLEQMSGMRTPQGSIAVFRKGSDDHRDVQEGEGLILMLDGIQDPGNLGTIVRTCDWFGIRKIVCSADTCDCWSPKVVQATMGALGRVALEYTNLEEWLEGKKHSDYLQVPVYGTLLDGRNMYESGAIADRKHGIIIMGNEGNGISEGVRKYISHPLYIPSGQGEHVESLNVAVATAVIVAEFKRL